MMNRRYALLFILFLLIRVDVRADSSQGSISDKMSLLKRWSVIKKNNQAVELLEEENKKNQEREKKKAQAGGVTQDGAVEEGEDDDDLLESPDTEEIYQMLLQALAEDPFSKEIHYNLGLTFELNRELDKSLKEYSEVIQSIPSTSVDEKLLRMKFIALFNSARVYGTKGEFAKALNYYQRALEIVPSSPQIKVNIELLIQQQKQQSDKEKSKKKDKSKEGKDKNKDPKDDKKNDDADRTNKPKKEPKPFDSKSLTKKDVDKILGELKNQEQKVRAKQNKKNRKDKPKEKDW